MPSEAAAHGCCDDAKSYVVRYDRTSDKSEGERWRFEDGCGLQGPEIQFCPFCGQRLEPNNSAG